MLHIFSYGLFQKNVFCSWTDQVLPLKYGTQLKKGTDLPNCWAHHSAPGKQINFSVTLDTCGANKTKVISMSNYIDLQAHKNSERVKTLPTIPVKKWHTYISMRPSVGPLIAGRIRVFVK